MCFKHIIIHDFSNWLSQDLAFPETVPPGAAPPPPFRHRAPARIESWPLIGQAHCHVIACTGCTIGRQSLLPAYT
jgi:hypothetical protein